MSCALSLTSCPASWNSITELSPRPSWEHKAFLNLFPSFFKAEHFWKEPESSHHNRGTVSGEMGPSVASSSLPWPGSHSMKLEWNVGAPRRGRPSAGARDPCARAPEAFSTHSVMEDELRTEGKAGLEVDLWGNHPQP